jgi:L-lactate dehydrogenase complex protein LldG
LPTFTGWGYSKDFPRPAWLSFRARFKPHRNPTIQTAVSSFVQNDRPSATASSSAAQDGSLLDRFIRELSAIDGQVIKCKSEELPEQIWTLLKYKAIDEIAAWGERQLPAGLIRFLSAKGLRVLEKPEPKTRAGLTGTLGAVADTGTLIIPGGPGRSLNVSLLPEICMAVLREEDIYENLEKALKLPGITQAAAVALVSGPSRTADIEMTMTIGAHGPAEVHVFCLTKESA